MMSKLPRHFRETHVLSSTQVENIHVADGRHSAVAKLKSAKVLCAEAVNHNSKTGEGFSYSHHHKVWA